MDCVSLTVFKQNLTQQSDEFAYSTMMPQKGIYSLNEWAIGCLFYIL